MFGFGKKNKNTATDDGTPQPRSVTRSPGPTSEQIASLDERRDSVLNNRHRDNEMAFWEAVLTLPNWHLIGTAEGDFLQTGKLPPTLTLRDEHDQSMVPVYSTSDRAARANRAINDQNGSSNPFTILELSVADALGVVMRLSDNSPNMIFDFIPGEQLGYGTQSEAVASMYDYFVGPAPIDCLSALSHIAIRSQDPRAYTAAYRCLARVKSLYIPVDKASDSICYIQTTYGVTAPAFTSKQEADAACDQAGNARLITGNFEQILQLHDFAAKVVGDSWTGFLVDPSTASLVIAPELASSALQTMKQAGRELTP